MSRVFVVVQGDDGQLMGIQGDGAVVVDIEREPIDEYLFGAGYSHTRYATRYRMTLEFPDGFVNYRPRPDDWREPSGQITGRLALPPAGPREIDS